MSFTCTLFSDKVRCFNQSKRALYGNFIFKYIMALQILCYPCGALLLRTKTNCFKRMYRLVRAKSTIFQVKYTFRMGLSTNVDCFSLWQNITRKTHAFQHCQCDKFSSSDVRFFLFFVMSDTTLSSWPGLAAIFQVTSVLLFSIAKNATVTAYLLESSLA